ncbi:hypothetical protein LCGC14_2726630 [marine sediment metagenome]|uniref:Uncharacterized protein n=1 Tax=marine sediment metagenome TaxID=412755 RepID=A0A0F9BHI1_9ZZZZ
MGVLTYIAKRNIIGGHTLGLEYKIETALQVIDESAKPKGTSREMLDDTIEYELDSMPDLVMVTSDEVLEADKLLWKEFTTSVAARELFQIDLTGTIASPGTALDCIIEKGAGYHPRRSQAGVQQYKFSFTVRLV